MGTLYVRGRTLWIGYEDPAVGKRVCRSSGYKVGQEAEARALLTEIEGRIAERVREPTRGEPSEALRARAAFVDVPPPGIAAAAPFDRGPTVREYGERWIQARRGRVATVGDEDGRLTNHVYPRIGHLPIREVRPRHVRDLVLDLKTANARKRGTGQGESTAKIAPRTVRHVFATMHRMFKSAVIDEVIETNPVIVEKGVLPKNVDKDPAWRSTAMFDRDELATLIGDERLPEHRRVLNALKGLGALRHGEAAGMIWERYRREAIPLGKLIVARSYANDRTKTEVTREVPVHPVLAAVLAHWFETGWARMYGRSPAPHDLIVPSPSDPCAVWPADAHDDVFALDLARLGLRHRRGHDLRRTFVTLAQLDGARRDLLKVVTHGPSADDIVSLYTSFPWPSLCAEVEKLAIQIPPRVSAAAPAGALAPEIDTSRSAVPALPRSAAERSLAAEAASSDAAAGAAAVPATGLAALAVAAFEEPKQGSDGKNRAASPAGKVAATAATVGATVAPNSPAISSRWPGMIRRPTVYETVALPLSYTGRSA